MEDDPKKYASRDPGSLTGGWPGGEVGLKLGSVPAWQAAAAGSAPAASAPPAGKGDGNVYVGKGRWQKGDEKLYPGREMGGLTGGWAGGEVGLKVKRDAFPDGARVRVKGEPPAAWQKNALFANTAFGNAGALGIVNSSFVDNGGRLKVATRLAGTADGARVVVFAADDLELAP